MTEATQGRVNACGEVWRDRRDYPRTMLAVRVIEREPPMTLTGEDYLELLPVKRRQINDYGIRIGHRTYGPCPDRDDGQDAPGTRRRSSPARRQERCNRPARVGQLTHLKITR
ncbi:hypothetical protein ACPSM1_10245 [Micromonospora chersina]|uniref:hypothetical protein n=1 Tax=Micromonospora chersina TaxID=47854 RepID=UPI003C9C32F4